MVFLLGFMSFHNFFKLYCQKSSFDIQHILYNTLLVPFAQKYAHDMQLLSVSNVHGQGTCYEGWPKIVYDTFGSNSSLLNIDSI